MRYAAFVMSLLILFSFSGFSQTEKSAEKSAKPKKVEKSAEEKTEKKAAKKEKKEQKKAAKKQKKKSAQKSGDVQDVSVSEGAICKSVENLVPVGAGNEFPADIKQLCCFTRIKGAKDTMQVIHKWYKDGKLVSSVPLSVKSVSWRTYSRHTMSDDPSGEWKIEVINSGNDEVINEFSFVVQLPSQ